MVLILGLSLCQIGSTKFPQQIQTIRICSYENAPKIYIDSNGQVAGFWADILTDIAIQEGWEIEWKHGKWNDCLLWLQDNQVDILPDTVWTEPRSQLFSFSNETVLISWTRLYARPGLEIDSILDLQGKTVAGLKGSVNLDGPEGLKDLLNRFDIQATVVEMLDYTMVFEALQKGDVDAGITNKDFGSLHEADYDVVRTPVIFQPTRIQFAFTKDGPQTPYLIERIDSHLKAMKADSSSVYYQALDAHLGQTASGVTTLVIPAWVSDAVKIGLGLILFMLTVILLSRWQVARRTAELDESQVLLKAVVNSTTDVIFIKDSQGRYILTNPGAEQFMGKRKDEILGCDDHDIFPENAEQIIINDQEIVAGGKTKTYEESLTNANGNLVTFLTTKGPLFDSKMNPIGLFGISRDITERKQMEDELRVGNTQLVSTLESMNDAFVAFDNELNYTYVNKHAGELLERDPLDLIGKNYWEEFPEAKGTPIADAYVQALETQTPILIENLYEPWNRWFENRIYPSGVGLGIFFTEITGNRKLEIERQVLLEIMQGLLVTEDLHTYLKKVHQAIAKVIYANNFFVILKNKVTNLFEEVYSVDQYDKFSLSAEMMEKTISAYISRTGKPLLLNDEIFEDLRLKGEVEMVGANSPSWLGVPLIADQVIIGVMVVQDYEIEGRYSEQDVEFLASIANQVAQMIKRRQAEDRISKNLEELELLSHIDRIIASSFDLQFNLDSILNNIIQYLGMDAADVLLFGQNSNILKYGAGVGFSPRSTKAMQPRFSKVSPSRFSKQTLFSRFLKRLQTNMTRHCPPSWQAKVIIPILGFPFSSKIR